MGYFAYCNGTIGKEHSLARKKVESIGNFTAVNEKTAKLSTLSSVQESAIDLYKRGLNVFPIPTAWEWRAWGEQNKNSIGKRPYILAPMFSSRLHFCGSACYHVQSNETFIALFENTNLGVMTGRTSNNLLGVDCDSESAFKIIGQELSRRELPFWGYASHRGGTYLLCIKEGEVANISDTRFPHVQIWGRAHYLVLPPSVHPQGTIYRWVTSEPRFCLPEGQSLPGVNLATLDWLGAKLAKQTPTGMWSDPELYDLPKWATALSRRNREALGLGVREGERNSRLTAAAYDMAGTDVTVDEAKKVLLEAALRCTPPYPRRDTLSILKSAYRAERQPARKSGDCLIFLRRAHEFASSFDWRSKYGRKSNSIRAVFAACVERARLSGVETWRATRREIAELANLSDMTAWTALQQLAEDKLIKHVATDEKTQAFIWKFTFDGIYTIIPSCSNSGLNSGHPKTTAEQDVFCPYGLGFTAWRVWQYLLTTPIHNPSEIEKAFGMSRSYTHEILKKLQSNGLISYGTAEGLYYGQPKTECDLEKLAIEKSVSGRSSARKRRHQIERELHANRLLARAKQVFRIGLRESE